MSFMKLKLMCTIRPFLWNIPIYYFSNDLDGGTLYFLKTVLWLCKLMLMKVTILMLLWSEINQVFNMDKNTSKLVIVCIVYHLSSLYRCTRYHTSTRHIPCRKSNYHCCVQLASHSPSQTHKHHTYHYSSPLVS